MIAEQSRVPWGLRDIGLAIVGAIVAVLLVLGAFIGLRQVENISSYAQPITLIGTIAYQICFFGIALGVAARHGKGLVALGYRRFDLRWIVVAASMLVLGFSAVIAYGLVLRALGLGEANTQRLDLIVGRSPASLALAVLAAGVVAPIAEETFFRGLVLPGLIQPFGLIGAVIASSALFALAHLSPQLLVPTFFLGVLLSTLRLASRSIWLSIGLHGTFNTVQLLLVYAALAAGLAT